MSVRSHSQQDQIEDGNAFCAKDLLDLLLISFSSAFQCPIATFCCIDLIARNRNMFEEILRREKKVTFSISIFVSIRYKLDK